MDVRHPRNKSVVPKRDELPERLSRINRRDVMRGAAAVGGSLLAGAGVLAGCTRSTDEAPVKVPVTAAQALQYEFPEDFLWGAGTSGLQHEGSPLADGAGPSAMYEWAHAAQKQKVAQPDWFTPPIQTFDVSADFYRRYQRDIQLMREMNLRAYNFEVYWPRILPEGTGQVNQPGLDFYDRLVDEFLAADIVPLCNLYVFDHPAALQERGGWLNRDMAKWYADYASILYDRLADRIPYWTTICELTIVQAFTSGAIAPAPEGETVHLRAVHHLLLGQGMAVQALRASGAKGEIGIQPNVIPTKPASDSEADVAAAEMVNARTNLLYLDPQLLGEYPPLLIESYGQAWPEDMIHEGDLETISAPIDFFGMDYYASQIVRHDPSAKEGFSSQYTEGGARGMRDALVWVRERYGEMPIFILEIGHAVEEKVDVGEVHDPARLGYLREVLTGAHQAIQEGVDLRACFIWSFLDGWEFGWGLSRRYGLLHVNFETQERILKDSGKWYRDIIAAGGFDVPETALSR